MRKREKITDYIANLIQSFDRWDFINEHGCNDPFWSDGINMNLVRNHIIYYKSKLEKEDTLFRLPDCIYREIPPEVDNSYMACPEEIRVNAVKSMQLIDEDENLKYVREQAKHLSDKVLKMLCIPTIIGYSENLRTAIANDDLITMRRYMNVSHYLKAFESAANKLKFPEILEQAEYHPLLDDEELFKEQECISETEQSQLVIEAFWDWHELLGDSVAEEPETNIQLTFF